jgi:GT2 family glycosyltransferase
MKPRVLVSIVTFNSARWLKDCLNSLKAQTFRDFQLRLWDNASLDESSSIAEAYGQFPIAIRHSQENIGFCAAHNRNISSDDSDFVLVLNPDMFLDARFIEILVSAMDLDINAGSATGKLWRWPPGVSPEVMSTLIDKPEDECTGPNPKILDSTGIYLITSQRHLDRGAGLPDLGQFNNREYVFGASGAAAFYRRAMLEEVKSGPEYFDEAFFAYREDADLAWRAQWLGWTCLYVPEAKGFHVRNVLPERRASLPPSINMHSFKNRFLLRIKNMDAGTYLRFFIPISFRDLAAIIYVLLMEWSSLRAIPLLLKLFPKAWTLRKDLQRRRRVSGKEIRRWFSLGGVR